MSSHDSRHIFPLFNSCWPHFSDTGSTKIINRSLSRVTLLAEIFKVEFKLEVFRNFLILVLPYILRTQFVFTELHAVVWWNKGCIELAAEHKVRRESLVVELKFNITKYRESFHLSLLENQFYLGLFFTVVRSCWREGELEFRVDSVVVAD
jgi:hypothetical protein